MKKEKNIIDGIKQETPLLDQIEKKNHFEAPVDYFESLPEQIQHKTLNTSVFNRFIEKLPFQYLIPASGLSVVLLVLFTTKSTEEIPVDLTDSQMHDLILEEEAIEFDDYLVYEAYAEILDKDIANQHSKSEEDEIIDYLIEQDIDIHSILEEL